MVQDVRLRVYDRDMAILAPVLAGSHDDFVASLEHGILVLRVHWFRASLVVQGFPRGRWEMSCELDRYATPWSAPLPEIAAAVAARRSALLVARWME